MNNNIRLMHLWAIDLIANARQGQGDWHRLLEMAHNLLNECIRQRKEYRT